MTLVNEELQIHWTNIAPLLTIHNEREYNAAVKPLNELLDEIGDNEKHRSMVCSIRLARSFTPTKKNIIPSLMSRARRRCASS